MPVLPTKCAGGGEPDRRKHVRQCARTHTQTHTHTHTHTYTLTNRADCVLPRPGSESGEGHPGCLHQLRDVREGKSMAQHIDFASYLPTCRTRNDDNSMAENVACPRLFSVGLEVQLSALRAANPRWRHAKSENEYRRQREGARHWGAQISLPKKESKGRPSLCLSRILFLPQH